MKKTSFSLLTSMMLVVLVCISGNVHAQKNAFEQGRLSVHAGYGFGNVIQRFVVADFNGEFGYENRNLGVFHGKVEYAATEVIGIGLSVNYVRAAAYFENSNVSDYSYDAGYENTSILFRFNAHFVKNEYIDAYGGMGIGYRMGKWWLFTEDPNFDWVRAGESNALNPFGLEMVLGIRYYFIPNLGVYAEVGMAKAPIQFGISGNF